MNLGSSRSLIHADRPGVIGERVLPVDRSDMILGESECSLLNTGDTSSAAAGRILISTFPCSTNTFPKDGWITPDQHVPMQHHKATRLVQVLQSKRKRSVEAVCATLSVRVFFQRLVLISGINLDVNEISEITFCAIQESGR